MNRVYIAGPYTRGNVAENVVAGIKAADQLMGLGYVPYLPHLSHFWHLLCPHDYETWMKLDFAWLETCQSVLRLPGESPGADRECELAVILGIPVYYSIEGMAKGRFNA